ncbi:MAG: MFS transporter, partial [Rhizobiales bacterium 35-68-8]
DDVADGSGLFNLMRNLGGAIGLALIDTTIFGRAPVHATAIMDRLKAGDVATATSLDIPKDIFLAQVGQPLDPGMAAMLKPTVEKLALVDAINDAWLLVALITVAALLLLPLVRRLPR